jgi:hypothetical protein
MTPHGAIHTTFTRVGDVEDTRTVVDFVGDAELALIGVLHFDHTIAVRSLEITAQWTLPEVPETFPTGV